MIDVVLKLVDRLVKLAKRREQVNAELHRNFVQPVLNDFGTMQILPQTLQDYRCLLAEE